MLAVKAVPSSSRDEVVGWLGDALKVRVRAHAEKGQANAAIENLLAAQLGLATKNVSIVTGHGAARKIVAIDGLTMVDLRAALEDAHGQPQRRDV